MSWFGSALDWAADKVSDFLGSGSSSSSSSGSSHLSSSNSNSLYEPDKIKVAEIEQQTQLQLAGRENERITLMKEAKLEILREEAKFQEVLNAAQANNLKQMSEVIIAMQASFNEVAQKRLQIIEQGSMEIIKDIERFYHELQTSIEQKDIEFTETKLPKLLEQLNKYEEGTPSHQLYFKKIDGLITNQESYAMRALTDLSTRQDKIITSSLATKEKITEHTDKLTAQIVEKIVGNNEPLQRQLNNNEQLIPPNSQRLLG